jgi:hypothetical protein
MPSSFALIADEAGIPLPGLLNSLLETGRTDYGSDWQSTWRERILTSPPPLISCYDFEWLDAASSRREIADWLNPQFQDGRSFLPFGRNGAGDVFCLMPTDGQSVGVAHIFHDYDDSEIGYRSFVDFVCTRFLETFADMSHLLDDFSEQEALEIVRADVAHVSKFLDPQIREYLQSFSRLPPAHREYRDGPKARPRVALSLIAQDDLSVELLRFPAPSVGPFPIVARWDVPSYASRRPAPEPIPDWRIVALTSGKKFSAIQSYQKEYGVSLSEAKNAIDDYIHTHSADT